MKIIIIGLSQSGRTALSKSLVQNNFTYIDAYSWIKSQFREKKDNENEHQFNDEFHYWINEKLKNEPNIFLNHVNKIMLESNNNFIIDGIISPKDFISLFDYNKDIVIFLNRTDNSYDYKDYENIAISVIRDYCFWLASANLLNRSRWLEFNFKMSGEDLDFIKSLGSKNSVFIVKSFNKIIDYVKSLIF